MADGRQEFLYEMFNSYYNNGVKAKEEGNIPEAKTQLLAAAETLDKLADLSTGDLKAARKERVMRLLEIVEGLSGNGSGGKSKSGASGSGSSGRADSQKRGDGRAKNGGGEETETQWAAAETPDITFADIAGLDDVKQTIIRQVINPRKHPEFYEKFAKKRGGGVLMYGLPGTGKTMMAKAIAAEVGCNFYPVRCSDIMSKWFGEAERNIKNLFESARSDGEAIIFLDEFEAVGAKRTGSESATNRLVPELLTQIQGFDTGGSMLMVIAATNRPWDIDSAFMRAGRFDNRIYIPLPDDAARRFLIEHAFAKVPVAPDVDIEAMVQATAGFTGADVNELCETCKNYPIDRAFAKGEVDGEMITAEDVENAQKQIKSSVQQRDVIMLEKFERGELT